MPISVTCSSCSASFKVKDEYAGKRAKCPKCGEPITIPTAFQAAETMFDTPILKTNTVPPKSKPAGDVTNDSSKPNRRRDEDDAPRSKPRSVATEDDTAEPKRRRDDADDEQPKGKKRRDADEEEDDQPRKKRRRDEPKKASNLPLSLGIGMLVLLVLVGGGIIAAVMWSKAQESTASTNTVQPVGGGGQGPGPSQTAGIGESNARRVTAGMTRQQVEAILGPGKPVDEVFFNIGQSGAQWADPNLKLGLWYSLASQGGVLEFDTGAATPADRVYVGFRGTPDAGTVAGVHTRFNNILAEYVKLPDVEDRTPAATLTVIDFLKDAKKYNGKWVTVKGKVQEGLVLSRKWSTVLLEGGDKVPNAVMQLGDGEQSAGPEVVLADGDEVTISGKVDARGIYFRLLRPQVTSRTAAPAAKPIEVTADALIDEILADEDAFEKKYRGKVVTVTAKVSQVAPLNLTVQRKVGNGLVNVIGKFDDGTPKEVQVAATVKFTGRVGRIIKGQYKGIDIEKCQLVK